MPKWNPQPIWKDEDVFIIGGGTSLKGFDWSLLYDEHTIGCNQAFRLGEKVCDICVFGDKKFLFIDGDLSKPRTDNYQPMSEFKNRIVTNDPALYDCSESWIWSMPRIRRGISTDALGWNHNTGATAINLALILGAKNVYLLGFDMRLGKGGKPNWHKQPLIDDPSEKTYERMLSYYGRIKWETEKKFTGAKIIHLLTGESKLTIFPRVDAKLFFNERNKNLMKG
jgi:hypothetical protein